MSYFIISIGILQVFACFLTKILFSGQEDYSFQELLPMAVIGVIGGLLGMCEYTQNTILE